jgi:hypothetical protein
MLGYVLLPGMKAAMAKWNEDEDKNLTGLSP